MPSLGNVTHILASAVVDDATVAIAYPTGLTAADFQNVTGGKVVIDDGAYGAWNEADPGFSYTYGASTITVTNLSGMTWPAGAKLVASFGNGPRVGSYNLTAGKDEGQAEKGTVIEQELTVTGTVYAGAKSVRLNHASTIIAATIANAANHAGFFAVTNTSASGTAAHTLTLTSGTFDGTNNTATLNAPAESLLVFFNEAGRGTIVVNTGSVALSSV